MQFSADVQIKFNDEKVLFPLAQALQHIMYSMQNEAARLVPVDTGTLKAKIEAFPINRFHWILQARTNYAAFVELGTGQRGSNTNAWPIPTSYHFGSHPGQASQAFMRPALELGRIMAPKVINYYMGSA